MSGGNPSQVTFDTVLDKIRKESNSASELGTRFEKLTKMFLETASPYDQTYRNITLWNDWKFSDGHDTGIDLMAETNDGQWCAIQCKCYADDKSLDQDKVNNFFAKAAALEKKHKKKIHLILVFTGERMTNHAEKMAEDHGCKVIDQQILREGNVNWSKYPKRLVRIKPMKLREYQKEAIESVVEELEEESRCKMIMACGTGKTLTSLRIAEKHAGPGKTVLYLVPSITLIQQTINSWGANANTKYHYEAVCSDSSIKVEGDDSNMIDDGKISDIPIPATTDAKTLKKRLKTGREDAMTVLFSTYQSLDVVKKAMGKRQIDLILCDEAHRTTGIEGNLFQKVHYNKNIKAKKRVYMTATPKQFTEKAKKKHKLIDMDDEDVFGRSIYEYSFSDAVDAEHLCDFKVRVPVFSEGDIEKYAQESIDGNNDGSIDERVLLAAVWHALNYGDSETKLLQRVIAFGNTVKASQKFSGIYGGSDVTSDEERYREKRARDEEKDHADRSMQNAVNQYESKKDKHTGNTVAVRHVDGTMSSNIRHKKMEWLKSSMEKPNECRILSNARCLSEGIDVPALDGIVFLQPRESQVDVIQAVGRVMRRVKDKKYGYVVIPVVLQKDTSLHESLENTEAWKAVWQVLKALRSHDPRFGEKIDKLALTNGDGQGEVPENVEIIFMGSQSEGPTPDLLGEITSQMVEKCGDRRYYTRRSEELGRKSREIEKVLSGSYKAGNKKMHEIIDTLHEGLKSIINDSVTVNATLQVLAQHYALSQVFNALFRDEFTSDNPIVRVLDDAISQIGLSRELDEYQEFFDDMKRETLHFKSPKEKEAYIKEIYGSFLKGFDKKKQESEGIVYTPTEVVDFIINSAEEILREEFGTGFNQKDVKIFDPFTGTGTFITRLLESGLIKPNHLESKYKNDIYANEISLLAYYVAAVGIESAFRRITGAEKRVPFRNINYTDTLHHHPKYRMDARYRQVTKKLTGNMSRVHDRIQKSKWEDIHVIFGNPPYSGVQSNYNDQNQNMSYPILDKRIRDTYIAKTKLHNKNSLYNSYIRSIRWASDRIEESGIIAFITPSSFIRSDAGAGIRACLEKEFSGVWCFDLRGDAMKQGEIRRKEGGNVFGSGSKTPVAITILVKKTQEETQEEVEEEKCTIHYKDIGDYLTREQKLETIRDTDSIQGMEDWQIIEPDKHYDWLDQRSEEFSKYPPIGSRDKPRVQNVLFANYWNGLATSRDAWAYNSSSTKLGINMKRHINYCKKRGPEIPADIDSKQAKWSPGLSDRLRRTAKPEPKFHHEQIRKALYRPFFKQHLYLDKVFIHRPAIAWNCFPKKHSKNLVICIPYRFTGEFSTFMTDMIPDLELVHHAQCFPLHVYEKNGNKESNITGFALQDYREHYKDETMTKEDIFYYVYALFHHPQYKKKFANNLIRELPHIPMAPDFRTFSRIGKKLADLHLNFDKCEGYYLKKPKVKVTTFKTISYGKKEIKEKGETEKVVDKTKLCIDDIEFDNIPEVKYQVNGRTPLEWVMDKYKIVLNKESGITNDPCTGTDIIGIIERAIYVGVESDKLVDKLPKKFEPENYTPTKAGLDKYTDSE